MIISQEWEVPKFYNLQATVSSGVKRTDRIAWMTCPRSKRPQYVFPPTYSCIIDSKSCQYGHVLFSSKLNCDLQISPFTSFCFWHIRRILTRCSKRKTYSYIRKDESTPFVHSSCRRVQQAFLERHRWFFCATYLWANCTCMSPVACDCDSDALFKKLLVGPEGNRLYNSYPFVSAPQIPWTNWSHFSSHLTPNNNINKDSGKLDLCILWLMPHTVILLHLTLKTQKICRFENNKNAKSLKQTRTKDLGFMTFFCFFSSFPRRSCLFSLF